MSSSAELPTSADDAATGAADRAIWHDVECGGYEADLPLWRTLAAAASGAVLELGCGTGRVALDLARSGVQVTGLDSDPMLVDALVERARGLPADALVADARAFELGRGFGLVIAPMQLAQLLDAHGRHCMLAAARRHLHARGVLAVALADPLDGAPDGSIGPDAAPPSGAVAPLPDVRELGGWVYTSTPLAVRSDQGGAVTIERARQAASPDGELTASRDCVRLEGVMPAWLEQAAARYRFRVRPAKHVPATDIHVGSTVVLLEAI